MTAQTRQKKMTTTAREKVWTQQTSPAPYPQSKIQRTIYYEETNQPFSPASPSLREGKVPYDFTSSSSSLPFSEDARVAFDAIIEVLRTPFPQKLPQTKADIKQLYLVLDEYLGLQDQLLKIQDNLLCLLLGLDDH